ncbi:MAG: LON peptidase substrate-binding domain-containing protein, partial [Actinomycetota bacterium]
MSVTETLTRLPSLHLPSPLLPGATVTITLTDEARPAVEAAVAAADSRGGTGRIVLTGGPASTIGVIARVPNVGNLPNGSPGAILLAEQRVRIVAHHTSETIRDADGTTNGSRETIRDGDNTGAAGRETIRDGEIALVDAEVLADPDPSESVRAATRELRATLELIAELRNSRRLPELLRSTVDRPGALADGVALWAEFADDDRLQVLHAVDLGERVDAIHSWARNHLAELQVAETIRNDVGENMNKQQREYMLRQQLNAIKRELGESDDDVVGEFREQLAALVDTGLVAESVTGFIAKELDRFEQMSAQSPEHSWV